MSGKSFPNRKENAFQANDSMQMTTNFFSFNIHPIGKSLNVIFFLSFLESFFINLEEIQLFSYDDSEEGDVRWLGHTGWML